MVSDGFKAVCLLIQRQVITYEQAYAILADMFEGIGKKSAQSGIDMEILND